MIATLGDVAHIIIRWKVADRTGCTGRLADVPVIEDELISPCGGVVKIMLPASADNGTAIIAAQSCLHCRFRVLIGGSGRAQPGVESILEQ